MTDNFDRFVRYINWADNFYKLTPFSDDKDAFYTVYLKARKKDIPSLKQSGVIFRNYLVNSVGELYKFKDEIVALCNLYNCRAYITFNRNSYASFAKEMIKNMSCVLRRSHIHATNINGNIYRAVRNSERTSRVRMIDIDYEDAVKLNMTVYDYAMSVYNIVKSILSDNEVYNELMPSKTGYHILCNNTLNDCVFESLLIKNNIPPEYILNGHSNYETILYTL